MCSGSSRKAKAKKKAKRQEEKARKRQERLDALAKQQEQRQRQLERQKRQLESQQAAIVAQQKKKVAETKLMYKTKTNKMKAKSEAKVFGIKNAGAAAATSLRILGQVQPDAPTARQTPRNAGRRGAGTTAANVARGSTQNKGFNLSI